MGLIKFLNYFKPTLTSFTDYLSQENESIFIILERTIDQTKNKIIRNDLRMTSDELIYECIKYFNGVLGFKHPIKTFIIAFIIGLGFFTLPTMLFLTVQNEVGMHWLTFISGLPLIAFICLYVYLIELKFINYLIDEQLRSSFNKFLKNKFSKKLKLVKGQKYAGKIYSDRAEAVGDLDE